MAPRSVLCCAVSYALCPDGHSNAGGALLALRIVRLACQPDCETDLALVPPCRGLFSVCPQYSDVV